MCLHTLERPSPFLTGIILNSQLFLIPFHALSSPLPLIYGPERDCSCCLNPVKMKNYSTIIEI